MSSTKRLGSFIDLSNRYRRAKSSPWVNSLPTFSLIIRTKNSLRRSIDFALYIRCFEVYLPNMLDGITRDDALRRKYKSSFFYLFVLFDKLVDLGLLVSNWQHASCTHIAPSFSIRESNLFLNISFLCSLSNLS